MKIFLAIYITSIFYLSKANDLFDGMGQQFKPCFELIHQEGCNTSIPNVYQSPFVGDEMNIPDTSVYLFTPKNHDKAEPLHRCGGRLPQESDFDPEAKTVVLIHGWMDGMCRTAFMREVKLLLFKRDKYNVILVDWTWGNAPDYARAESNALTAGDQIGFVIKNIMEQRNVTGDNFHIIGHSLGTFAAGLAAKFILKWNPNNKIGRITGLEPSTSANHAPTSRRLSYKDAKFVDVMHTNGGNCFPFYRGTTEVLGHADFYPNGGTHQPSCFMHLSEAFSKGDLFSALGSLLSPALCSHLKVLQFFKATIPKDSNYIGIECNSYEDFKSGACKRCCKKESKNCAVAGMDAEFYFPFKDEERRERKYYFDTANHCPFAEDYELNIYRDC